MEQLQAPPASLPTGSRRRPIFARPQERVPE